MKQSKKIFTRMVINNWGGISHKVMEFHEYVNLFSGKSGSGKSTQRMQRNLQIRKGTPVMI